jgi:hypothetical protein
LLSSIRVVFVSLLILYVLLPLCNYNFDSQVKYNKTDKFGTSGIT